MRTICPTCGAPFEPFDRSSGAECRECRPPRDNQRKDDRRGSSHTRGYDHTWRKLSERARRRQPFCSDCGRTDDLTADHSTEAWKRKEAGLPIRLKDIDVVCRQCNTDRGAARGDGATDEHRRSAVEIVESWLQPSEQPDP